MDLKRTTRSLVTAFLLTSSLAAPAVAASPSTAEKPPSAAATMPNDVNPECIVCGVPRYKVRTISGPVFVSKRHVKYLTTAWAKASSYTWSATTTTSSQISASVGMTANSVSANLNVTTSTSQSWGVSVTIPAVSSMYSKLALRSDFNRRYVAVDYYSSGKLMSTKYAYHYSPRVGAQYLMVTYQ